MQKSRVFPTVAILVVAILAVPVYSTAGLQRRADRARAPRLLVVISIDQMRGDTMTRFAGYMRHGLRRMQTEGMTFAEAHHDHGVTVTAAGHATLSTGCTPASTGIIGNDWFDRASGKQEYCTGDDSARIVDPVPGAVGFQSPRNLRRPALGDWLKAKNPASKVFSIAGKDRSAILMGGRKPDGAYWYNDKSGRFVTSSYYATSIPKWLESFNAVSRDNAFRTGWVQSMKPEDYLISSEDAVPTENDCKETTFPHGFTPDAPGALESFRKDILKTPFADEMTLDAAQLLISSEGLGADRNPDILWIGLSAADYVGHAYGPLSQEAQDYYFRIDRRLGEFLRFLDERIGPSGYVVALSSDHGSMPLPEDLARRGYPSSRVLTKDFDAMLRTATDLAGAELGLTKPLYRTSDYAGVYIDLAEATALGIESARVRKRVAAKVRELGFVADAMTWEELSAPVDAGDRQYLDMYRRSFASDRSPDVLVRPKEFVLMAWKKCGTSHGTPYRFDTHVPMLFFGAGIPAGQSNDRVRTIDLAPTLAALLSVTPPSNVDGRILRLAPGGSGRAGRLRPSYAKNPKLVADTYGM